MTNLPQMVEVQYCEIENESVVEDLAACLCTSEWDNLKLLHENRLTLEVFPKSLVLLECKSTKWTC